MKQNGLHCRYGVDHFIHKHESHWFGSVCLVQTVLVLGTHNLPGCGHYRVLPCSSANASFKIAKPLRVGIFFVCNRGMLNIHYVRRFVFRCPFLLLPVVLVYDVHGKHGNDFTMVSVEF